MLTRRDLHTCVRTQKGLTHTPAHTNTPEKTETRACTDECWHTVTHTNAPRAQVVSHPPLVRASTFFHHSRIPQMMYLRHLAVLAIFMDTEK